MIVNKSSVLKTIADFLSSLTLIDVIFFFSVLLLLILIVTLLYFIKLNEDVRDDEKEEVSIDDDINTNYEHNYKFSDDEDEEDLIDLESITKALENKENNNIDLTAFEEEQEKEAIISYDELINKAKYGTINYKSENMFDDLSVKEVDLNNMINEDVKPEVVEKTSTFINYEQEEAFLEALKKLQKQIN